MSSVWGSNIKLSIFGESHSGAIGVVLDNLPANEKIDLEAVAVQMARRAPGKDKTATPRKEADLPKVLIALICSREAPTDIAPTEPHTENSDAVLR